MVTTTYTLTAQCGESIITRQVTVYVDEEPPPAPSIEYNGDELPVMPCDDAVFGFGWYDAGLSVRFPSNGNHADNPNLIFDPLLIAWWAEQTMNYFLASGTPYSGTVKLYWCWQGSPDSWNAQVLFDPGVHIHYINDGWEICLAYCPA